MTTDITTITKEVDGHLADKEAAKTLVETTFKGLSQPVMRQAIIEGMLRGFDFRNFLQKDVYAVPFGQAGYSLVTSIDHARKIGSRSGVVGVNEPVFETDEKGLISTCAVTIKKRFADGYIGDFTAKVYFAEYTTGKNLWVSKPRTMISKVAEMHALRKACPEETAQIYVAEELDKENKPTPTADIGAFRTRLEAVKSFEELRRVWAEMPVEAKTALLPLKEELKKKYAGPQVSG